MINNIKKYYTHSVLWSMIVLVTSGSVAQAFLLEYGFSEENVTVFCSVMQIVQVATIFFFSKSSDRVRSVVKTLAYAHFLDIPLCLFLLALCFFAFTDLSAIYIVLLIVGGIYSISVGIHNVLSYKMPYVVIDISYYAKFVSISGALIGIVAVAFSAISQWVQSAAGYMPTMKGIYILIPAVWIFFFICTRFMKEHRVESTKNTESVPEKINLFKYKPFVTLILPNVLRGFCLGIVSMGITIGYYTKLIDGSSANYMIMITNAISILGSFAFSKIARYVRDKNIIFICSIVIAALLPFLTFAGTAFFLAVYTVIYLFLIVLNNAVPVTVTKIIDFKVAGQYSAGRMLLNTLGTSVAGFVCVPMFESLGVVLTLTLAGLAQILSGIGYYIVLVGIEKKKKAEGAIV